MFARLSRPGSRWHARCFDLSHVPRSIQVDAGDCARGPPWSAPYATIAARRSSQNALFLPVLLDGQMLQAEVDTGASVTSQTTNCPD